MNNRRHLVYRPFESLSVPRPVDRITYLRNQCRHLRVLDVGAFDETEVTKQQHSSWRWLHAELASVSKELLGVDSSPHLRSNGRITTSCGTTIVYGSVENMDDIVLSFRPDIIVAGELIEHTPNTLEWISRLGRIAPGVRFVATTPNATSLLNLGLSLIGRENCHQDHLQIYSFKTLTTLSRRLGMQGVRIIPYYYNPHLFLGRTPRFFLPFVSLVNLAFLVPVQFLCPLTAFGLILDGILGKPSADARKPGAGTP